VRALYSALNFIVTSSEAIICKRWLVRVHDELRARFRYGWDGDVVIVLWIHDELAACCRPEIAAEVGAIMVRYAVEPAEFYGFKTPLAAEFKTGQSWANEPPIPEQDVKPNEPAPAPEPDPAPEPKQEAPRYSGNGHAADDGGYTFGTKPHGTATKRYFYKDASGLPCMRVTRTDSKTFPTDHWRDGRWVSGWPKTVVPYRLPELLEAPPTEPVWICEGEKDSDNVAALGLIATTNPGGALVGKKNWRPELTQYFKDKQLVYILEDNDAAGREHTAKVVAVLTDIVPNIAVVSFAELPEGNDVSDWLEDGGTKKLLLTRAEEALKRNSGRRNYITTDLSSVNPRAIRWLWHKHLARGALELLAGLPTVGKSQIQCQYVACATTGRDWPNGAPGITPCRAIMLTAEDNTDDTLVPRLVAAGANLSRIKELKAIRRNGKEELFLLGEDLNALEQLINDWGDVGLVTIDPITAYMGHAKHFDSHRATDVRSQLSPLKVLAERTGVAISAVTHPPKNVGQRALDHFIGSQAFIAAARLGHLCIEEMTEDAEGGGKQPSGRYLFTDAKPSIKAKQPTLAYRIDVVQTAYCDPDSDEPIEAPVIRWEGESELSADEAIAASRPGKARAPNARDFLLDILAGGKVVQKIVIERGNAKGFSYYQLWRAKDALGVVDFREKGVQSGPSYWALPQHVPDETEKS
jgi:putative DNA primase/helicase